MGKKRILVAALNWGLGHATRSIPIIKELQHHDFQPILASDGAALKILQKEFPHLPAIELPSYNIEYSKSARFFNWKMLMNTPDILSAIKAERALTEDLVKDLGLDGIISDNRFGVRSDKLKTNVFITHQLNVLSGNTTSLSSYIHRTYINKFQQCWVPDLEGANNLSGILGHPLKTPSSVKYIGPLSRFEKKDLPIKYHYLIILSGPEPQRSILESILLKEFKNTEAKTLLIRGVVNEETIQNDNPKLNIKNYLYGSSLEEVMNCSKYVISRSGYTSIMDFAKLNKKAFFIPTPGQKEQEYLAETMEEKGFAPFSEQRKFKFSDLKKLKDYNGLSDLGNYTSFGDLFTFFHGE